MANDEKDDGLAAAIKLENSDAFRVSNHASGAVLMATVNRTHIVQKNGKREPIKNDFQGRKGKLTRFTESTRLFTLRFDPPVASYGPEGSFHLSDLVWDAGAKGDRAQIEAAKEQRQRHARSLEEGFQANIRLAHPKETTDYDCSPYPRSMVPVDPDGADPDSVIRVQQFNLLAHGLSNSGGGFAIMFAESAGEGQDKNDESVAGNCRGPRTLMGWDVRKERVLSQMLWDAPDVITAQELDHYHDWLQPAMAEQGYEGDFWNKPKSVAEKYNGGWRDGCAVFWCRHKFEQLGVTRKFIMEDEKGQPSKQVGLYVVLRNKLNGKIFAVIVGHFKSGKKKKDIPLKCAQARYVAGIIDRELQDIPVIVGMDFNSHPEMQAFKEWSKHTPKMGDAYRDSSVLSNPGEHPEYTTYKWRKGGDQPDKLGQTKQTIDFIFYTRDRFRTRQVQSIPPSADIEEQRMPAWRYPSDHFAITADLELL